MLMDTRRHSWMAPLFVLLLGLVVASCDQAGVLQKASSEQARTHIESALDGLAESMRTLEQGAFSTAVKNVLGLDDGVATSADWAAQLGSELNSVIEVTDDDRFRFDESTGVYVWDADDQTWVQTDSAEAIVLRFPASKRATSNNATLTLHSYSDVERSIRGRSVYLPDSGTASLMVDSTEVFSATLADITFAPGLSRFPIPTALSLDVLTAPHTHVVRWEETGTGRYTLSAETRNNDQLVAGLSTTVQAGFSRDGLPVDSLSGDARIGPSLTVPYTVEVDELQALDDPSAEQINDPIDARIDYDGETIATLRYDGTDEEVNVVYLDGTAEPAAAFYKDFLKELQSIWSDYLGGEVVKAVQEALSSVGSDQ
jgi:hypothetical protein